MPLTARKASQEVFRRAAAVAPDHAREKVPSTASCGPAEDESQNQRQADARSGIKPRLLQSPIRSLRVPPGMKNAIFNKTSTREEQNSEGANTVYKLEI